MQSMYICIRESIVMIFYAKTKATHYCHVKANIRSQVSTKIYANFEILCADFETISDDWQEIAICEWEMMIIIKKRNLWKRFT